MPRAKEFDPQEALHQAMILFWEKGYTETSYEDLVEVTGVSRYGLYSAFGDKYQLFLKAMDHYSTTSIEFMLGPMEQSAAAMPEIRRYFDILLSSLGTPQEHFGCLIGNSSVEIVEPEEALLTRINHHFARMRAAFHNALRNAQQRGEISVDLDTGDYSDYLVGVAMGYLVCVRGGVESSHVRGFIQVALSQLN